MRVGDKIRYKETHKHSIPSSEPNQSREYTVLCVDSSGCGYLYDRCGAVQGAHCPCGNHTWGASNDFVDVISNHISDKKGIMQKLTPMLRRLLDKNTQTLYKAGYINGDLELTDSGRSALNAVLFEENKDALVKLAQESLAEEKEK